MESAKAPLEEAEMEEKEAEKYMCDVCFVGNLTHSVNVKRCNQCNEIHCIHYTSKIDPQYCIHCMHDVTLEVEFISKAQAVYNPVTDEIHTRTRKAKKIRFIGMHWLFAQRKINEYNDVELELAQEYHRTIYNALIYEREQRRIDYIQKKYNKNTTILNIPSISSPSVTVRETTTVKKSRAIKSSKPDSASIDLMAALAFLKAQGLSGEQIIKKIVKK